MKLLDLTSSIGIAEEIDSAHLASATGKGVQDVNQLKTTFDPNRSEYDPLVADTNSPVRHQRSNVFKNVIDSLNDLELFLVRSDDFTDSQLRNDAAQLRQSILTKLKNATPLAAATGPSNGGVVTSISGVAS